MYTLAAVYAFISAIFFSLSNITVRKGLIKTDSLAGTFITILISPFILLVILQVEGSLPKISEMSPTIIIFFAMAGIVHFVAGRTFVYTGFKTIGASRASPPAAINILFTEILGITLLGESFALQIVLGAIVIFSGMSVIYLSQPSPSGDESSGRQLILTKSTLLRGMTLAIIGAFFWGISPILVKMGLLEFNYPVLGVFISYVFATVAYAVLLASTGSLKRMGKITRGSLLFLIISGVFTVSAQITRYISIALAPVIFVTPIIGASSLFAILFSRVFIQKLEMVDTKVVLGGLLVVFGLTLVLQGG